MNRVVVTGGRDYTDWNKVGSVLDAIHAQLPITLLAEGGAEGADALAHSWARTRGIPAARFHAHWDFYGNAAGPRRNAWMLEIVVPDLVVAFPGGRGTEDMVRRAHAAGFTVQRVNP